MALIQTPLTQLFNIKHPVLLAGMFVASGPRLAAAVTNAGGLGVIGGLAMTPKQLRMNIAELKSYLDDKNAAFGVDLALPKIGGGARKTNHDYTQGHLDELVDIIIKEKTALFVCAIGVCPPAVVQKLHKAGVVVANMVGHPKHVSKVIDAGVDIVIAQGGEGGGHTGDVPFSILIPACVDAAKGRKSPSGKNVIVLGAGGVTDGRSLAAALSYGAEGVWVGTRFVASVEAAAPKAHKNQILDTQWGETTRTVIYSGRPLRCRKTPYVAEWEDTRQKEIEELTSRGIVPHAHELEKHPERSIEGKIWIMGANAPRITEVKTAKEIVDELVEGAVQSIQTCAADLRGKAKL